MLPGASVPGDRTRRSQQPSLPPSLPDWHGSSQCCVNLAKEIWPIRRDISSGGPPHLVPAGDAADGNARAGDAGAAAADARSLRNQGPNIGQCRHGRVLPNAVPGLIVKLSGGKSKGTPRLTEVHVFRRRLPARRPTRPGRPCRFAADGAGSAHMSASPGRQAGGRDGSPKCKAGELETQSVSEGRPTARRASRESRCVPRLRFGLWLGHENSRRDLGEKRRPYCLGVWIGACLLGPGAGKSPENPKSKIQNPKFPPQGALAPPPPGPSPGVIGPQEQERQHNNYQVD